MTVLEERFSLAAQRVGEIASECGPGDAFDASFAENAGYASAMAAE